MTDERSDETRERLMMEILRKNNTQGSRFYPPLLADILDVHKSLGSNRQWRNLFDEAPSKSVWKMVYRAYLLSAAWQIKRQAAMARTNEKCAICWFVEASDVHHLTYKRIGDEAEEDLQPLCRRCHEMAHGKIPASDSFKRLQEMAPRLRKLIENIGRMPE